MLSSNPLTASVDIQKTASAFQQTAALKNNTGSEKKLGEFADDILNISTLGQEKQRTEAQLEASIKINEIASEVIKVSTSIGKARFSGSLTHSQATDLYNKIAAIL